MFSSIPNQAINQLFDLIVIIVPKIVSSINNGREDFMNINKRV